MELLLGEEEAAALAAVDEAFLQQVGPVLGVGEPQVIAVEEDPPPDEP
ncbi:MULTISPECIES: hypothetical protein [unclassified Meiothermus]|nr:MULTISPECIES: hypothetical protein [unclassified Meiothermus]